MATREMDRDKVRSAVLTLRLTQAEMLRFKLAALNLKTDRAKLVRERVSDLIGGVTTVAPVAPAPIGGDIGDTVANAGTTA